MRPKDARQKQTPARPSRPAGVAPLNVSAWGLATELSHDLSGQQQLLIARAWALEPFVKLSVTGQCTGEPFVSCSWSRAAQEVRSWAALCFSGDWDAASYAVTRGRAICPPSLTTPLHG